jgi:hypothetical protein
VANRAMRTDFEVPISALDLSPSVASSKPANTTHSGLFETEFDPAAKVA